MKLFVNLVFILTFFSCAPKQKPAEQQATIEQSQTVEVTKETKTQRAQLGLTSEVGINFLNSYVENANKMDRQIPIMEFVQQSNLVTESFKIELTKLIKDAYDKDPEYGLGFDPVFNGQDYDESGFNVSTFDQTSGYLTAEGKNWKSFRIILRIVQSGNSVLVDGCGSINIPEGKHVER